MFSTYRSFGDFSQNSLATKSQKSLLQFGSELLVEGDRLKAAYFDHHCSQRVLKSLKNVEKHLKKILHCDPLALKHLLF